MISKSSYVKYKECGKSLWLHFNKPEEAAELSEMAIKNIEDGNQVGQLAKQYFPNTVDCSVRIANDGIDYNIQIGLTKEAIANGANAIAEASFMVSDLFCAVDILKKETDGYSIYEVKSPLDLKDKHKYDIAFQKYVLSQCGINVGHMYLMHPNRDYIFDGKLDLNGYFKVECVDNDKLVLATLASIDNDINDIRTILSTSDEQNYQYIPHCIKCDYFNYCSRNLPKNSIGELNGLATKAFDYYNKGIYTIFEYVNTPEYKTQQAANVAKGKIKYIQESQIKCVLEGITEPVVDKDKLGSFLSAIKYPVYYLDFETTRIIVPVVEGMRPNQEIVFQYSLHIEQEDGTLRHEQYLGNNYDCERELAEKLLRDIPCDGTIMAQHASVEKGVIQRLAEMYPDLHDELMKRHSRFVDLEQAFTKGAYYSIKMGGRSSIKSVLPALCPHMENAYHALPLVHDGKEALAMFKKLMATKDPIELNRIRQGMLEYCKLDTLSMVKILRVLKDAYQL